MVLLLGLHRLKKNPIEVDVFQENLIFQMDLNYSMLVGCQIKQTHVVLQFQINE
jgi:hypothetical protein